MFRFISVAADSVHQAAETLLVPRDAIHSDLNEVTSGPESTMTLVYDAAMIPDDGSDPLKLTITEARNGVPYRPPFAVRAAGGYITRRAGHSVGDQDVESVADPGMSADRNPEGELEVLLIFRRGVWDLPKGKLDKGESIQAAALREVREEVGADGLRIIAPVGTTIHGYPEGKGYAVKTTYWFLMATTSERFTPQLDEQIDEVRWVPWDQAIEMLGYDTLRVHMASIEVRGSAWTSPAGAGQSRTAATRPKQP